MLRIKSVAGVLVLLCLVAGPALAQVYPSSGQIYLSFDPVRHIRTLDVAPDVPFDLWIVVEIPVDPTVPLDGVVGVEGAVALPPSVDFVEISFEPPAINLGASYREPGLETFVVGLGECIQLGPEHAIGKLTLVLNNDQPDVQIGIDAPAVEAAAISSFAGIGPGWARRDCLDGGPLDLVLFDPASDKPRFVTLNSTAVPVRETGFSLLKARY